MTSKLYRIGFIDGAIKAYNLQIERMEQLEQLCCDLYACCYSVLVVCDYENRDYLCRVGIQERMEQLGLLDGEQNEK